MYVERDRYLYMQKVVMAVVGGCGSGEWRAVWRRHAVTSDDCPDGAAPNVHKGTSCRTWSWPSCEDLVRAWITPAGVTSPQWRLHGRCGYHSAMT